MSAILIFSRSKKIFKPTDESATSANVLKAT